MSKQYCEKCKLSILQKKRLTEKQTDEKFNELVEQEIDFGGLAPKNEPFKNMGLITMLLHDCFTYYECPLCGWYKFKKGKN
jgi:hypothetical protein